MSETLTATDVRRLAQVIAASDNGAKVARLIGDDAIYGVARGLTDEQGMYWTGDVRDAFLRVTTRGGFEAFWPVRELANEVGNEFAPDYDW